MNGKRLDIADGAADLDDEHVRFVRVSDGANRHFYLVGDVRDHLDGLAEIIPAAFFLND